MKYEYIYISGKITGDPNFEAKFRAAQDHLETVRGWNYWYIVNPVEHCCPMWPWWRCMLKDLWLMRKCKYVAMLPDWTESRGARIEHKAALWLKKEIIYLY